MGKRASPAGRSPRKPEPRPSEDRPPDEISLLQLVNILLRHRWLVVVAPAVVAFLVVAVTLLLPRSYTATASFSPEASTGQVQVG